MAWREPRTWVYGELITAEMLNDQVRDNFKAIGDAWTPYEPTWTATDVDPTLGDGALVGRYRSVGKTTNFSIILTVGSATSLGSGVYNLSLPVTAFSADVVLVTGYVKQESDVLLTGRGLSTTAVTLYRNDTFAAVSNSNAGLTAGSKLMISGTYEAA